MNTDTVKCSLNDEMLLRYSRHILLNEIGITSQTRLQQSRVLVVGAGGLGCPASLYLACAGIGHLIIADPDHVDLTNLQRQILFTTQDVSQNKALTAAEKLKQINPELKLTALNTSLSGKLLEEYVAEIDLVLDCCDNFKTRYQINQACLQHKKPLISGSAIRFEGQLACFHFNDSQSSCYECLFPNTTENDETHCATMGVFAPLTGIIGTLQASEALKVLGQFGQPLMNHLIRYNALTGQFKSTCIPKDPMCKACGSL